MAAAHASLLLLLEIPVAYQFAVTKINLPARNIKRLKIITLNSWKKKKKSVDLS